MQNLNDYQLIDFGGGRKLERFSNFTVDRPCPAAQGIECAAAIEQWQKVDLQFSLSGDRRGKWVVRNPEFSPDDWQLDLGFGRLQLSCTPVGHLGVFPEQADNWRWIQQQLPRLEQPRVLNLFAYTGASTLAAIAAGGNVTHVDAAKNMVTRARHNAQLSGFGNAPVRWIVDDVRKYVSREIQRKSNYQAVILDPPTYGHGAKGEAWHIDKDLPELLTRIAGLYKPVPNCLLLTCHSPGWNPQRLSQLCRRCGIVGNGCEIQSGELQLTDIHSRSLPSGVFVRIKAKGCG